MTILSNRSKKVPESPFRKLASYIQEAKSNGVNVIPLNIGDPDSPSPKSISDFHITSKNVGYPDATGMKETKQAFIDFYGKQNIPISQNEILVTTGASEGIVFALLTCCNAGDNVLTVEPFYANNFGFCVQAEVELKTIKTDISNNFELPSYDEMKSYVDDRTRVIMVTSPSNPIGRAVSVVDMAKYIRLALEFNLYLLVDEVYGNFIYDSIETKSFLKIEEIKNLLIIVESVSKRFSLCGVRIGALISRNIELINACAKFAKLRLGSPVLGQLLTVKAFGCEDGYLSDIRNEYDARRRYILSRLEKMKGVTYAYPNAGFYIFIKLPVDDADKFCEWLIKEFRYNNYTIALCPGHAFYLSEGKGKDEIRIAYVTNLQNLEIAMDCLEEALIGYKVLA